jgi:glycosyltransferase involved in cell wall biosynthesis
VVVSTADGVRGFGEAAGAGVVVVPTVTAMAACILRLLHDAPLRHRLERHAHVTAQTYDWRKSAVNLRALYASLGALPA